MKFITGIPAEITIRQRDGIKEIVTTLEGAAPVSLKTSGDGLCEMEVVFSTAKTTENVVVDKSLLRDAARRVIMNYIDDIRPSNPGSTLDTYSELERLGYIPDTDWYQEAERYILDILDSFSYKLVSLETTTEKRER